jgi:uncharacterized protein (DUF934 family)
MRQILRAHELRADDWRYPGESGPGPLVLDYAALLAAAASAPLPAPSGVSIGPVDDVERLAPLVAQLDLVVVQFPKAGEGRGFTQAQLLRQRLGYQGELRAAGYVKRDQLYLLARCGFDAFELSAGEDPQAALAALSSFSVAYQQAPGTRWRPRLRS